MKQFIYIFISLFLFGSAISAQNATEILDKAATIYTNSNGIIVTFAMRTHSQQQNITESFEGKINIKGDKFTLVTPGMHIWYDGKTQWIYKDQADEVNINIPTDDELQFTNPAILLKTYKKAFNASFTGESTATNGKAAYDIELTPKKKNDITKITLQIEKFSGLPANIAIQMKNDISNNISISELKKDINQPDSFFSFNEADYPDAFVIDLRDLQ